MFSADGVAMGAAISMSETHITMIVFFAIMLHKVSRHDNGMVKLSHSDQTSSFFSKSVDKAHRKNF